MKCAAGCLSALPSITAGGSTGGPETTKPGPPFPGTSASLMLVAVAREEHRRSAQVFFFPRPASSMQTNLTQLISGNSAIENEKEQRGIRRTLCHPKGSQRPATCVPKAARLVLADDNGRPRFETFHQKTGVSPLLPQGMPVAARSLRKVSGKCILASQFLRVGRCITGTYKSKGSINPRLTEQIKVFLGRTALATRRYAPRERRTQLPMGQEAPRVLRDERRTLCKLHFPSSDAQAPPGRSLAWRPPTPSTAARTVSMAGWSARWRARNLNTNEGMTERRDAGCGRTPSDMQRAPLDLGGSTSEASERWLYCYTHSLMRSAP